MCTPWLRNPLVWTHEMCKDIVLSTVAGSCCGTVWEGPCGRANPTALRYWSVMATCCVAVVFLNVSVQGKRLAQNWSFCKSTLNSVLSRFYKCFSQRMSVFNRFFQNEWTFEQNFILLKSKIQTVLFPFNPRILLLSTMFFKSHTVKMFSN